MKYPYYKNTSHCRNDSKSYPLSGGTMRKMSRQITVQSILQQHYAAYEAKHNLPYNVRHAAERLIDCRTTRLGGHKYYCSDCGEEEEIVYNPCHHRICPNCANIAREEWLKVQKSKLIATNYYHIVFTIPEQFNVYWLKNVKLMTLIRAKETLIDMCLNPKLLGAQPGIIATLHTWDSTLTLHPHIHYLITDGGLDKDGVWINSKRNKGNNKSFLLPIKEKGVMDVFRAKFVYKMIGSLRKNQLCLPDDDLFITEKEIENKFTLLKGKKWNVNIRERYEHGNGVATYLANYLKGGAIGNSRIKRCENGKVVFTYKNSKKGRRVDRIELDAEEFIHRLLLHVPVKGQRLVLMRMFNSNGQFIKGKVSTFSTPPTNDTFVKLYYNSSISSGTYKIIVDIFNCVGQKKHSSEKFVHIK